MVRLFDVEQDFPSFNEIINGCKQRIDGLNNRLCYGIPLLLDLRCGNVHAKQLQQSCNYTSGSAAQRRLETRDKAVLSKQSVSQTFKAAADIAGCQLTKEFIDRCDERADALYEVHEADTQHLAKIIHKVCVAVILAEDGLHDLPRQSCNGVHHHLRHAINASLVCAVIHAEQ